MEGGESLHTAYFTPPFSCGPNSYRIPPFPKLNLEINNTPKCVTPAHEMNYNNGEGRIPRRFVRLELTNPSQVEAKGCKVCLLYVYRITGRSTSELDYPNTKPLFWNEERSGYAPKRYI